jgi:penicillin amidase/acyl-homoserine-lactone acylase
LRRRPNRAKVASNGRDNVMIRSATAACGASLALALCFAAAPAAVAQSVSAQTTVANPAAAAKRDVRIRRDQWGVPHVYGRTNADAAFGIGYAHSEDDFATMQEGLTTARGQLASVKGASGLNTDWMFHLMDIRRLVDERYERDLPPEVRAIVEAYADGVNAYAAEHPEKVTPGRTPSRARTWSPTASIAGRPSTAWTTSSTT